MRKRLLSYLIFFIALIFVGWDAYGQTQIIITPDPAIRQFTVPAGVTSLTVEVWGAGGRGSSRSTTGEGGGGGGGAYSRSALNVTPGQIINYYVGFGSLTPVPGQETWFLSNTILMARGGNSVADNSNIGAIGGAAATGYGDVKYSGGNGANASGNDGGGGASSAGIAANGNNAINRIGATAPIGGGNGGNGFLSNGNNQGRGENGIAPGGGGGGSRRRNASGTEIIGGYGGDGQLRISYIRLTSASGTDDQSVCENDPIATTTYTVPTGSTVSVTNLPAGLSPNYNGTNTLTISGTPTASGTYTITATPSYFSSVPITLTRTGTVTVIRRPAVANMTATVCSGETFTVTPIDGANGFVPTGTTYSWGAPSISWGITGGATGTGAINISGTLTNPTNPVQTAIYTVTPTVNGCTGPNFTVTVTIDPVATINNLTDNVCTGDAFTISPANGTDGIVPSGTTYNWNIPTVTGGLTGGVADSGNSIAGTLTNPTNTPQTATYTVTPTSGICDGPDFTVTVTVNPGPDISDISTSICSEGTFDVSPVNGTNGIVPAGTTYTWNLLSVTGGLTGGTSGSGSNITGTLTNPTSSSQTAIYEVTPTSGSCSDNIFLVTVTVDPKPEVTDIADTICSGDAFTVTPIDGTNGINPTGTTYTWGAPSVSGGLTGGASSSGNNISGTLTNPTNTAQTATYTVTPLTGSCTGNPFTVVITLSPRPAISNMISTVCSGDSFTTTPVNGTNGVVPAGTTYSWTLPVVTGGITGGATGTGASNISGTLTNPTNTTQTATYTVTPLTGSCTGTPFTVVVTLSPRPAISNMTSMVCSGDAFSVTPVNGTNGVVPAGTTYSWGVPSVTGGMTGAAAGTGAANISGTLNNPTNTPQTATYTVTPTSGSCAGSTFTVTVTVSPKPAITNMTTTVCSSDAFSVTPVNSTNGVVPAGTKYSWGAPAISGGITGGDAGTGASNISGTLINPTNTPQTATYTVTPTVNLCTGPNFTVTVTIDPVATINNLTDNVCTGDAFTISPANGTDGIVPSGTTYTWNIPTVTGGLTGGAPGSGNSIPGTLTNPTNTPQTATYTVTPSSGSCTGPDFTITITVDPITAITVQPSNTGEIECFGDGFDPISVTAVGGGLTYQWYSKTDNLDPITNPGVVAPGATSARFNPPSTTPFLAGYYYYVEVTGNCGMETSSLSGEYIVTEPATTIMQQPLTDDVETCKDDPFLKLEVSAIGELDDPDDPDPGATFTEIIYQWYSNTSPLNTGGTLISGENSPNFFPPSNTVGTMYYYATATSKCGTVPTDVSGEHTVTPFTTIETESLVGATICEDDSPFGPISITASGTGTLSYQWYRNTSGVIDTNVDQQVGTNSDTFTPLSNVANGIPNYYYVEVSSINGCGTDQTSSVSGAFIVNPLPEVNNPDLSQTICSGGSTTEVLLTSNVSGTTFAWTATASGGVSGFTASGSGPIPIETISTTATTQGTVTYVITPTANGCPGPSINYTVFVEPLPTVTNASLSQEVCSGGSTTEVVLISDVLETTFDWTATATSGVSGFTASGIGAIPVQTIITTESSSGTVTYEITPTANSCDGPIATYTVVVNPIPTVNNASLTQTICSGGSTTQVDLTSDVSGTTFTWTATATAGISGFTESGTELIPVQTIATSESSPGTVTYEITLAANGCNGPVETYTIVVNPVPTVTNTSLTQTICSGGSTTQVDLTSDVFDIAFNWTASASSTDISGFTVSGSGPIPVETISNSGTAQGTVTYSIIPSANGCSGPATDYVVSVDPLPVPTFTSSPPSNVCAEIDEITYTTQPGQSNYQWNIPGAVAGTDYTIAAGGIGAGDHTVSLIWVTDGTKTVEVSYTDSSTGCVAANSATSMTDVEALATVGNTSISFPSVCISNPTLTPFTQPTTGVTGIGTPTGLPPDVLVNFDASTGEIEFSGNVSGATPGLYSYSIPLTGNCINGLNATGTIDVTPNYELTSVGSVSATVLPGSATIIINGNLSSLPDGQYEVTYILDDGINPPIEETSELFSVSNGRGSFPSIELSDETIEVYELTIKSIKKVTDVCTIDLDVNDPVNTTFFSLCGAPFNEDGTFYVPAGIYEITIQAIAAGNAGNSDLITIPVTPGETLGVFVGEGGDSGTDRDTWVTRDSSDPNPQNSALIYVGGTGGNVDGQVLVSYSCPDPISNDCIEIIDDGAKSGTTVIRFNCDDLWQIPEELSEFSVFAIGGGGGGGMGPTAGGGGAGGFTSTTFTSTNPFGIPAGNSLTINVGEGGTGSPTVNDKGGNGGNTGVTDPNGNISVNLNAQGGGGGGSFNNLDGGNGASGGGGAYSDQSRDIEGIGGSSIPGQGNNGGNGGRGNKPNHARGGAGGGGVGGVGENGDGAGVGISKSGVGGDGVAISLGGTAYPYGAGGGGIGFNFNGNTNDPGLGGEVNGVIIGGTATDDGIGGDGTNYTGSGGGAGTSGGGRGGNGVVYITYENFSILEVEYQYFTATYSPENRSALLNWATVKEWENSHFEIERSVNGVSAWTKIGQVEGNGYSELPTEYKFTDTKLPASGGIVYYRLKQVDFDDSFSYSITKSIKVDGIEGQGSWIAYPNPSSKKSTIMVDLLNRSVYNDEPILIQISDIRGVSETFTVNQVETVSEVVNRYMDQKIQGVYILQLIWGSNSQQLKLLRE